MLYTPISMKHSQCSHLISDIIYIGCKRMGEVSLSLIILCLMVH